MVIKDFPHNFIYLRVFKQIMSQERILELRGLLFQLERKIKPLEWDLSRNQINEFRKQELERIRNEHNNCLKELNELEKQ